MATEVAIGRWALIVVLIVNPAYRSQFVNCSHIMIMLTS